MKTYIYFVLFISLPAFGFAQQQKTLHQTFEIEEVEHLNFNLYDEIEVEKWEGNTVLTETKVEVHDASKGIFNHFVNAGRYEIELSDNPGVAAVKAEQYELNTDYFDDDETTTDNEVEEPIVEEEVVEEEIAQPQEGAVYLTSKDTDRKPIRTREGECLEVIKIRIFIPEDFTQSGENSYFRTLPDDEADN